MHVKRVKHQNVLPSFGSIEEGSSKETNRKKAKGSDVPKSKCFSIHLFQIFVPCIVVGLCFKEDPCE